MKIIMVWNMMAVLKKEWMHTIFFLNKNILQHHRFLLAIRSWKYSKMLISSTFFCRFTEELSTVVHFTYCGIWHNLRALVQTKEWTLTQFSEKWRWQLFSVSQCASSWPFIPWPSFTCLLCRLNLRLALTGTASVPLPDALWPNHGGFAKCIIFTHVLSGLAPWLRDTWLACSFSLVRFSLHTGMDFVVAAVG